MPIDRYNNFRLDRSPTSHPPDPINPTKFRKNGGGVLVAIKSNLELNSKQIKSFSGAEIIAIELTLPNGSKIIVCTCYRVGTLETENYNQIVNFFKSLCLRKKFSKLFVIGDFNLSNGRSYKVNTMY